MSSPRVELVHDNNLVPVTFVRVDVGTVILLSLLA
jgi:hypothetical protein